MFAITLPKLFVMNNYCHTYHNKRPKVFGEGCTERPRAHGTRRTLGGATLGGRGGSGPPTFLERGTDPLTFCDHLVPQYYKSKAAQLWRAACVHG